MNNRQLISLIVPVFNEEGNIRKLHKEIVAELEGLWYDFELIFVDDGSDDESVAIIKDLHAADSRIKLVRFTRNFGHQVAISAGLEHAKGDAVIMMDADLQHPPSLIPDLIRHWNEGFDVVHTVRKDMGDIGLVKRGTSRLFYKLINLMGETKMVPAAADFRLMDRKVVDCLNAMKERSRFMRGLVTWTGYRQTSLRYVAGERHTGKTKYSLRKMLSFAGDGITSFSTVPLRLSSYLGLIAALAVIPYALWAVYVRLFTDTAISGWASVIVAILFLGGVQLVCVGIVGEYVGRIYEEVKGRPLYIVGERVGFANESKTLKRALSTQDGRPVAATDSTKG